VAQVLHNLFSNTVRNPPSLVHLQMRPTRIDLNRAARAVPNNSIPHRTAVSPLCGPHYAKVQCEK
jgi:hypothetical protein